MGGERRGRWCDPQWGGKRSNRLLKTEEMASVRKQLEDPLWSDFGPRYAQEELWKQGYRVGRESVRRLQLELGLRMPGRQNEKHFERRERRTCFGELVQVDMSIQDSLEGRGGEMVLIAMIDDANSRLRFRFFKSDNMLSIPGMIRIWMVERTVKNDHTIHWNRRRFQITLQNHPGGLRGGKVEVEARLDGNLALRFKETYLELVEIEECPSKRRRPAPVHPGSSRSR